MLAKEGVPHKQKPKEPEEVYYNTMNAMARMWKYLGNYGGYRGGIPGPNTDIELEIINKNKDHWLRVLKGLEKRDRDALIISVSLLNRLLLGFVRKSNDILKDENEKEKGGKLGK